MSNLNIEDIINETTGKNNIMLKYAETCLKECEPGSDNYNKALKIINTFKHNDPKFKDLKQDMKSLQLGMVKASRKLADQHNEKTASESAPIHNKINSRAQNESAVTDPMARDIDIKIAALQSKIERNERIQDNYIAKYGSENKYILEEHEKLCDQMEELCRQRRNSFKSQNESTADILADIDYLLNESSGKNGFDARLAEERYKNSRIDDPMSSTYGDIAKAYLKAKEDNKHGKTKIGEAMANSSKKNIDAINDKNKASEIHNKINNRVQNESTEDILTEINELLNF